MVNRPFQSSVRLVDACFGDSAVTELGGSGV